MNKIYTRKKRRNVYVFLFLVRHVKKQKGVQMAEKTSGSSLLEESRVELVSDNIQFRPQTEF